MVVFKSIGYGNVSCRAQGNNFFISGSKTGSLESLNETHYSEVIDFDVTKNWVQCKGGNVASSESMSHAVLYQNYPEINAVFHVHHLKLWNELLWKIPTTPESAPYGSPEMANEILNLFHSTDVMETQLFAMAGHREGLFAFGHTLEEAGNKLLSFNL